MRYVETPPAAPLRAHVECYWALTTAPTDPLDAARTQRVLPDGCMDVIFDLTLGTGRVIGTMTRALVVPAGERVELLGVRFRPGRAAPLLGVAAAELRDGHVDGSDLDEGFARDLGARLAGCAPATLGARCRVLDEALLRRLALAPASHLGAQWAVERVLGAPSLRVDDLARQVGLGVRQLERVFLGLVGVGPKAFARIVRFRRLVERLRHDGRPRWAALAVDLGFYDQPHLVREFRRLAGLAPNAYLREQDMSDPSKTATGPDGKIAAERGQEDREEVDDAGLEGDADPDR